jgi:hypothetical protein
VPKVKLFHYIRSHIYAVKIRILRNDAMRFFRVYFSWKGLTARNYKTLAVRGLSEY